MAELTRRKSRSANINAVAESAGRALARAAGALDALTARHPLVTKARKALAAGQQALVAAASKSGVRANAGIKKTKPATKRRLKTAVRASRPSAKAGAKAVAKTTRKAKKIGETVSRRPARSKS